MLQVVQDDHLGIIVGVRRRDRPQKLLQLSNSVRLDGEHDDELVVVGGGGKVAVRRGRRRGGRGVGNPGVSVAVGEVLGESGRNRVNAVVALISKVLI